ncbi:MAG: cob(I)yrinic acid a,c-diamide adenosyltransferase [Candidatus Dojkabacteria bacterium]
MKIYTKTGDKGETSLIGKRISKDAEILDVLGTIDELNSSMGIILALIHDSKVLTKKFPNEIKKIGNLHRNLFTISGILAGAKLQLDFNVLIDEMEKDIDSWTAKLPELTKFILPGGSVVAAEVHFSRTICRSVERIFVGYTNVSESRPEHYVDMRKYFNRLSDWLFTLARFTNYKLNIVDTVWESDPDSLSLFN